MNRTCSHLHSGGYLPLRHFRSMGWDYTSIFLDPPSSGVDEKPREQSLVVETVIRPNVLRKLAGHSTTASVDAVKNNSINNNRLLETETIGFVFGNTLSHKPAGSEAGSTVQHYPAASADETVSHTLQPPDKGNEMHKKGNSSCHPCSPPTTTPLSIPLGALLTTPATPTTTETPSSPALFGINSSSSGGRIRSGRWPYSSLTSVNMESTIILIPPLLSTTAANPPGINSSPFDEERSRNLDHHHQQLLNCISLSQRKQLVSLLGKKRTSRDRSRSPVVQVSLSRLTTGDRKQTLDAAKTKNKKGKSCPVNTDVADFLLALKIPLESIPGRSSRHPVQLMSRSNSSSEEEANNLSEKHSWVNDFLWLQVPTGENDMLLSEFSTPFETPFGTTVGDGIIGVRASFWNPHWYPGCDRRGSSSWKRNHDDALPLFRNPLKKDDSEEKKRARRRPSLMVRMQGAAGSNNDDTGISGRGDHGVLSWVQQ